jgi:hypothetical protein
MAARTHTTCKSHADQRIHHAASVALHRANASNLMNDGWRCMLVTACIASGNSCVCSPLPRVRTATTAAVLRTAYVLLHADNLPRVWGLHQHLDG